MTPTIEQHSEMSHKRTGKDYRELHDRMNANPRKKDERHNVSRISEFGSIIRAK